MLVFEGEPPSECQTLMAEAVRPALLESLYFRRFVFLLHGPAGGDAPLNPSVFHDHYDIMDSPHTMDYPPISEPAKVCWVSRCCICWEIHERMNVERRLIQRAQWSKKITARQSSTTPTSKNTPHLKPSQLQPNSGIKKIRQMRQSPMV